MQSKLICGLMLILPLVTYTACSDDDSADDSGGGAGGRAGAHAGGRAGASGGGRAGATTGGSDGLAGNGTAGEDTSEAGSGGVTAEGGVGGGSGGSFGGTGGRGGSGGATGGTSGASGSGGRGGAGGIGGSGGRSGAGGLGGGGGSGGTAGGAVIAGSGGGAGVSGGGGTGGQAAVLSNAQVVKVLVTVNQGEVAAAQAAVPAAQAAAVKNFAAQMITEHSAANALTLALVSTKHIAPQASAVSERLEAQAADLLTTLSQTPQATFDRVYIQSQISMHQDVLTLIDSQLLPSATDADLRALVQATRTSVAMHLQTAQTILTAL